MSGIAGQAAVAIDNARLYQAAQREISQRRIAEQALQELNEQLEVRVATEIGVRRRGTKLPCSRPRRWKPSGNSPAASPTTSTTCCR